MKKQIEVRTQPLIESKTINFLYRIALIGEFLMKSTLIKLKSLSFALFISGSILIWAETPINIYVMSIVAYIVLIVGYLFIFLIKSSFRGGNEERKLLISLINEYISIIIYCTLLLYFGFTIRNCYLLALGSSVVDYMFAFITKKVSLNEFKLTE